MITTPNDYKENVSPQNFPIFSRNTAAFDEVRKSFSSSNSYLNDEKEVQEAFSSATSTVTNDSKFPQKIEYSEPDSPKSPKRNYKDVTDPAFLTSNVMPLTLTPLLELDLHRDVSITSQ